MFAKLTHLIALAPLVVILAACTSTRGSSDDDPSNAQRADVSADDASSDARGDTTIDTPSEEVGLDAPADAPTDVLDDTSDDTSPEDTDVGAIDDTNLPNDTSGDTNIDDTNDDDTNDDNDVAVDVVAQDTRPDTTADVAPDVPTIERVRLVAEDYDWLVAANKGSLLQLDNMDIFDNFNIDPTHPAFWPESTIASALNALLYNAHEVPVGTTVEVTYDYYDGTRISTATITVTVEEATAFDVVPYQAQPVVRSNPTRLFVHYMPWFESRPYNGYWGSHWRMTNRNPDVIEAGGRRQIASHYYPLIGPYASADPDLVEYHLLLMKLSGFDGVLIDWYGTFDVNDYAQNLTNSNALIDKTDDVGLEFGIVYEDRTTEAVVNRGAASTAVEAAIADFSYMRTAYFGRDNYITANNGPLLLTFTPVHIETGAQWSQILGGSSTDPTFLAIWGELGDLGASGDGEFSWVTNHDGGHLARLENFSSNTLPGFTAGLGSAYAGFEDYYQEGGWGDGIGWEIAHNGVATLEQTLGIATTHNVTDLQLITWNDFGEGTMLEPTVEFGYDLLAVIQGFAGVTFGTAPMTDVKRLYDLRKQHAGDPLAQARLDQVYFYIVSLRLDRARALLDTFN